MRNKSIIMKMVLEELGRLATRSTRGFGASQPYTVKARRESLGEPGILDFDEYSDDLDLGPVKVSRAFNRKEFSSG